MDRLDLRRVGATLILLSTCAAGTACSEPFDTTGRPFVRGTLGEEIYKVVCKRMALEVWPSDVQGNQSRALCCGDAPPSTAPEGSRLRALAENRDRLVAALDQTLPAELEDELETMLLAMLPFYDPPRELLPSNTRAIAALLTELMADDEAMQALGRISQRRGMHPQRNALGLSRPILSYPGLPDLATSLLSVVDDGGALEPEWSDVLEAGALEMATSEPSAPDDPTLAAVRDLLFRTHASFGSATPRHVVARDSRGLPIPAFLDGSEGFVDLDSDGLADVDDLGRFVAADGTPLDPPTPFAVVGETGVTRDAAGRAMTASDEPLYVYQNVEQTLLAALLREAPTLFDPADPVLIDLVHGLLPALGVDEPREEAYGKTSVAYDGFHVETGAAFDVVHALGEVLTHDETRDLLEVLRILLQSYEGDVVPLIESGLFGDALGDQHPEIDLAPNSEIWDDVLQVATWMAQAPGLAEGLLRAFTDPRSKRLGAIIAEMNRFKDVPHLDPNDEDAIVTQFWNVPVDRTQPNVPGNMSLFQQTVSVVHEFNGLPFCNKEGARIVLDMEDMLGWTLIKTIDLTDLMGGPWAECELVGVDNVAHTYAQFMIGQGSLPMNLPIMDFINQIKLAFPVLIPVIDGGMDFAFETLSGIKGFDASPSPQAMARLIYGTPNKFIQNLIAPIRINGVLLTERYPGNMVLSWERVFRFCGDRILDQYEPCPAGVPYEEMDFFQAATPVITAFLDFDPLVDDDNDPATPPRLLYGEVQTAMYRHYPTAANPMYQSTNPSLSSYALPDNYVSYEPLVAAMLADCEWQPSETAPNRTCVAQNTGRMFTRLARVTAALDKIVLPDGRDGIDVIAAAVERLSDPTRNPGLANRAGETTTQTNQGTRTLPYTPMYLILDALNRMDDAHATDAARNDRWLSARSRLVDMFIKTQPLGNDKYQLENRRLYASIPVLLDFFVDQIDAHAVDGDLVSWARSFDDDLASSLGGAMGARALRLLDAFAAHPETEQAVLGLLHYLADENSPNDAFENLLMSSAESLFLLEDDQTMITLMHSFAGTIGADAMPAVSGGGAVDVEAAIFDQFIGLLAETNEVDEAHTFFTVMRNAVTHPSGAVETPIEVIADVIAEVNRVSPNAGGPLVPNDYGAVMQQVEDMLTDEDRGLERVYSIVQNRELQ